MGTMEDMRALEAVIRRIAREEITRALGAVGAVAEGAMEATGGPVDIARGVVASVMERVARDVLADEHPALNTEHAPDDACTCGHDLYRHRAGACFACSCPGFTTSTPSTAAVHTITDVPARARPVCSCSGHVHVMGHDNLCAHPRCRCWTPVLARTRETCPVCKHGEHDQGLCGMHVYVDGRPRPCLCLASRTFPSTPEHASKIACTLCEHAPHGAGNCQQTIPYGEAAFQCTCGGQG